MKRFCHIFPIAVIAFIALCCCPSPLRGAPNLSLALEQQYTIAARPFTVVLAVSWEGDAEQYLVESPRLIPPQGITLTGSSSSTGTQGVSHLLHYRYTLYAAAPGNYVLDPLEISYWEKHASGVQTVRTDALTLKVTSFTEAAIARYRLPGALLLIFISLFTAAFVLSTRKKKTVRASRSSAVPMGDIIASELNQCRAYKINGDWGKYLQQVIAVRSRLADAGCDEKNIDELRKLAERVHFGGYRPTAEEINVIQRQLEKACGSFLPGKGEGNQEENSLP